MPVRGAHAAGRPGGGRADRPAGPPFATHAAAAGIGSMLCLPLHVDATTYGTLSLYADTPRAFKDITESVARVLAVLAAITLSKSAREGDLEPALASRDLIGQAKGIIMHAHA